MPGQLRPDDLERCQPIELMIPDLIDRAHAAFTQAFENFVALAQHGAGLKLIDGSPAGLTMVFARSAGSRMRVAHLKHARYPGGLLAWQTGHSTRRSWYLFNKPRWLVWVGVHEKLRSMVYARSLSSS